MIKKIILCVLMVLCFGWSFRIAQMNQNKKQVSIYNMNESIDGEEMSVTAVESHLYEQEEFLHKFSIDEDLFETYKSPEGKVLCVCLAVKNISNKDIEWAKIEEWTNCGFESRTWGSTNLPVAGQYLNVYKTDKLYAGNEQLIWYVTLVNPICFKDKTWSSISINDFRYTVTLIPEKIQIRLE